MSTDPDYCRTKAAPAGSNLHYALMFEPEKQKRQLLPLFALYKEISDCLTASYDPGVNRLKLHWWSDELDRLSASSARHPVTMALQQTRQNSDSVIVQLRHYLAAIDSIVAGRYAVYSFDDHYTQLTQDLGQVWIAASRQYDNTHSTDAALIGSNGGTIFLLELAQNSHPLLSRGYCLYPDILLQQHGLSFEDVLATDIARPALPMFRTVIDRIADRLDSDYTLLRDRRTGVWYDLIMNRLARSVCAEIKDDGYQLLRHRIALTPLRKLWIAVRTRHFG